MSDGGWHALKCELVDLKGYPGRQKTF